MTDPTEWGREMAIRLDIRRELYRRIRLLHALTTSYQSPAVVDALDRFSDRQSTSGDRSIEELRAELAGLRAGNDALEVELIADA